MLVISPWTRQNYVSHNLTNTASVVRFIEDNWLFGRRIGGGSYDAVSGSLYAKGGLLNFRTRPQFPARHPRPDHRGGRQPASGNTRPAAALVTHGRSRCHAGRCTHQVVRA